MGHPAKKKAFIIGVMGGKTSSLKHLKMSEELGKEIALNDFILLNGGKDKGIMHASAKGAYENGGTIIGILPDDNPSDISKFVTIPIITGIGNARNQINILSSSIVVAFPGGPGTISEIAFALKLKKFLIIVDFYPGNFIDPFIKKTVFVVKNNFEALKEIKKIKASFFK